MESKFDEFHTENILILDELVAAGAGSSNVQS